MKKKSLLLTAVAMLGLTAATMAQNVPNYVPTNGLVGWWPFTGNANDASVNANNGTNIGATLTTDRFGNSNNAYSFDGASNYIDLTNSNFNISGNANRTLSAWAKTSVNGKGIFATGNAVSSCPNSNNGKTFNIVQNNDRLGLMGFNCGACPTCDFYPVNGQVVVNNNWNLLVLVLENGTLLTYVNGVLDNTSFMPLLNTQNNFNFIGKTNHIGAENYFNGKIDDVGIWNRALTQQEITNLYNGVNCANNTTITPSTNILNTGSTAIFSASTSDSNPSHVWQSDFGQGYVTLNNFGNYSGTNTATLNLSNVQLSNHNLPIRVITTSGNCIDTSNVAVISIADTCINTITDTTLITVTDTLLINTNLTGVNPPNNVNTIKLFPNPSNDHITINYGNFSVMNGYQLKIENAIGQQVFQTNITQQSDYLNLTTWGGNGLYFVHIINPQGNTIDIRKIVLQ